MEQAIKALLNTDNQALIAFTNQNLLEKEVDIEKLCLALCEKILEKQQSNGSWLYLNKKAILHSPTNYDQYQTYKTVAELVVLWV